VTTERDQRNVPLCQLRFDCEVEMPELKTSVFILPESITKTKSPTLTVVRRTAERLVGNVSEVC
jgi:hypothetical protein